MSLDELKKHFECHRRCWFRPDGRFLVFNLIEEMFTTQELLSTDKKIKLTVGVMEDGFVSNPREYDDMVERYDGEIIFKENDFHSTLN